MIPDIPLGVARKAIKVGGKMGFWDVVGVGGETVVICVSTLLVIVQRNIGNLDLRLYGEIMVGLRLD